MLAQSMHVLANACDEFKVKPSARIVDAAEVVDTARSFAAEIRAEIEPDRYSLTAANIATLHAAMVAWPNHVDRLTAADSLLAVAESELLTAWDLFAGSLLETFRKPFDTAVAHLIAGDTAALGSVQHLARVRTELANTSTRAKVRADALERITRLMVIPDYDTGLNRVRSRTEGLEPYSPAWFAAVHALDCRVAWQTPADQEAADRVMPSHAPAPTAA